jgi:heptosyltransferase I
MRIMLVKLSSMGDVVHNLPVATDIRRAMPGAVIDWAVEPAFASIVELHPAIDRVFPIPLRALKKRWWSPAAWAAFHVARRAIARESYDLILDTQGLVKSVWALKGVRGRRAGYDAASAREPAAARHYDTTFAVSRALHAVARNRALAAAALGYEIPPTLDYGIHAPVGAPAGRAYAVFLHGTSRADKGWPEAHWRELVARTAAAGLEVILPGGSDAECARAARLAQGIEGARAPERAPLDQLAALLEGARVVVGVDTGLAHLAVALSRPTIGIYLSTQPGLTGLHGSGDIVNLGGGTEARPARVEIDAVWAELAPRLAVH